MPPTPTQPPGYGDSGGKRHRANRSGASLANPTLLIAGGIVLALLLAVSGILLYRFLTSETFSASHTTENSIASGASPNVYLTNENGSVTVTSGEGPGAVEYEMTGYGTARDRATANERATEVEAVVERVGAAEDSPPEVTIETSGGDSADYALRVPTGASVYVVSGAGPVEVSGVSGDVSVESEAGDVTVGGVRGSVEIDSGAGDVTVRDVTGETGSVEVDLDYGDVSLSDLVIATLDVETEAGTVTLGGRFAGGGEVSVETGNIALEVPEENIRNVSFETRAGEVIRADVEEEG